MRYMNRKPTAMKVLEHVDVPVLVVPAEMV